MTDFQKVFEFSPSPYLLLSPEFLILDVNKSYLRATNTNRNEIIGKNVFEVFPENPNDHASTSKQSVINSLQIVIETKKPHIMETTRYDIPLPGRGGEFEVRFWSPCNIPVLNDGGELLCIIHNVVDVTALMKSQKSAAVAEAKEIEYRSSIHTLRLDQEKLKQIQFDLDASNFELKLFIQLNPVPMVLWRGEDHIYTIVNNAHDKMLRRPVLGKSIRQAHSPEEAKDVPEILDHVYKSGVPFVSKENHYRIKSPEGQEYSIWVSEWFYPLRNKDGEVKAILGVAQDVTEQVSARESLIQKQDQLQRSISTLELERGVREQFVATLTHDLRVPLSAAKLTSQMIARKAEDTALVIRLSDKVNASIDRIHTMIRDLLDANRIKAGEPLPLDISEFDMTLSVKDIIDELGTEFGDRFTLEAPSEPIIGKWSRKDIQRVIENLCSNAVKYGSQEENVLVKIIPADKCVEISVKNYGNTISPEDQKYLFEPYRRTQSALTGQAKGWGLGLTLVKGIVEAHKGTVKVESSAKKGTVFTVSFPLYS